MKTTEQTYIGTYKVFRSSKGSKQSKTKVMKTLTIQGITFDVRESGLQFWTIVRGLIVSAHTTKELKIMIAKSLKLK